MQTTAAALLIAASTLATTALAQQTDRLLHFTATASAENFQEIATVIHAITGIPQANVDASEKSLSLQGTPGQVGLAEWLFTNLDKPTNVPPSAAKHEYRVSDSADDVVRLFYLKNPEIPQGVQEIATAVRSLVNIRQMFTYNELRAVVVRGPEEQIRTAEFLFNAMDKPGTQQAALASPEFRMNQQAENLVQVFYLPNTKTIRDFQEVATLVRSIMDVRRLFTYNSARAVAMRGTDDQMAVSKWLFANLDAASATATHSGVSEYRISPTIDDLVRIIYLTHAATPERLQQTATQVRNRTRIRRLFTYTEPGAIVVRDNTEKLSLAARLIQEQDK